MTVTVTVTPEIDDDGDARARQPTDYCDGPVVSSATSTTASSGMSG